MNHMKLNSVKLGLACFTLMFVLIGGCINTANMTRISTGLKSFRYNSVSENYIPHGAFVSFNQDTLQIETSDYGSRIPTVIYLNKPMATQMLLQQSTSTEMVGKLGQVAVTV